MDIVIEHERRRPRWLWLLLVGVSIAALFWWLAASSSPVNNDSSALQWQQVQRGTVRFTASGVGELYASEQRAISALESGYITEVLAKAGDTVDNGDVLMILHNPQLQLELEAAQSELRRTDLDAQEALLRLHKELAQAAILTDNARADLEVANSELDSYQQLLAVNSVSRLQYEQALAKQRKSQNNLDTALQLQQLLSTQQQQISASWQENLALTRLRAERMQQRVDSLTMRASQHGIIKDLMITKGDAVSVGARLAAIGPELPDSARLQFPQRYNEQLKVGTRVQLSLLGQLAEGAIVRISPDLTQGAVQADVTLTSIPPSARIGMAVRADAQLGEQADVLYINTLFEADLHKQVRIWRQQNGKLAQRQLSNVSSFNGVMVFTEGVSEGERIAVDPQL
ncbi:efflux RND transporter periplasmic adaptor subunit [Arsukibacterium sp.]|uniref:efflux RND transporter periplasmic adaptor subunit n=1 Tax=Arsukibacterium sp. TaxID=1977258 RepID=UPI002FDA751D